MAQLTINSVEFRYAAGPTAGYIDLPHYICGGNLYAIRIDATIPGMSIGNRYPTKGCIITPCIISETGANISLSNFYFEIGEGGTYNVQLELYTDDIESQWFPNFSEALLKSTLTLALAGYAIDTQDDTRQYDSAHIDLIGINNVKTYRTDINGNLYETVGGIARVYQDGEWKFTRTQNLP